jgi:hypothetical protein
MVALTELDALRPVAEEATRRLDAALATLTAGKRKAEQPTEPSQTAPPTE